MLLLTLSLGIHLIFFAYKYKLRIFACGRLFYEMKYTQIFSIYLM